MGVYLHLFAAGARSRLQYRLSFAGRAAALFFSDLVPLVLVGLLTVRFRTIAGWTFPQLALLYGLVQAASGLSRGLGWALDHFDELVASGNLDTHLTRPVSPLLSVMAAGFDLTQIGRIVLGFAVLGVAFSVSGVAPSPGNVALAVAAVAGGALMLLAFMLAVAALSFWQTRTGKLQDIVQGGTRAFAELPLSIYPSGVRAVLTFVLPLALATYFPAAKLLGRAPIFGPSWLAYLALPAGLLLLGGAWLVWRAGVARYQSTGS